MTKIKLCGLMKKEDIIIANELKPEYIGFVFAKKSKRYVYFEEAAKLKAMLDPVVKAVGVFVNEDISVVEDLLRDGIIDAAQLHGNEDEGYIERLKSKNAGTVIKAFVIKSIDDLEKAKHSRADHILLDAGYGDGKSLDWDMTVGFDRPYFLAGGLEPDNVAEAIQRLRPYGVDVSSGIETDGSKDPEKMTRFVDAVRASY